MKKVFIILLVLLPAFLFANQITNIAVIDLSRIYSAYYQESRAAVQLATIREEYQEEIARISEEISQMENQKMNAENRGDEEEALDLDNAIFNRQEYLRNYIRVKNAQIQQIADDLSQSSEFIAEIYDAIVYVQDSEGYSIVLKKSDSNIVSYSPSIDITDLVLARLRNN